jgi:hypothetical protein
LSASATERGHLGGWLRHRALTLFTAERMFDDYDDVYRELFVKVRPGLQRLGPAPPRPVAVASPVADRAMVHAVS